MAPLLVWPGAEGMHQDMGNLLSSGFVWTKNLFTRSLLMPTLPPSEAGASTRARESQSGPEAPFKWQISRYKCQGGLTTMSAHLPFTLPPWEEEIWRLMSWVVSSSSHFPLIISKLTKVSVLKMLGTAEISFSMK